MIQNNFVMDKLRMTCDTLKEQIYQPCQDIVGLEVAPGEYQEQLTPPVDGWKPFAPGERLQGRDAHFWLRWNLRTPAAKEGKRLWLQLTTGFEGQWNSRNPQCLIFLNGEMTQAMDTNHYRLPIETDTDYEIHVSLWLGMENNKIDFVPALIWSDEMVEGLYYDLLAPYEACMLYDAESQNFSRVSSVAEQAVNLIRFQEPDSAEYHESLAQARAFLKEEFYEKMCGDTDAIVNCIGHTHIDVAWLWTLEQTREKAQRSFATVLRLMEEYPEYKFMSSQPKLYQYVKQAAPHLYEQIKKRVAEGRWEVDGAMWLEADCNLISGESMVRQILQGKKFMKDEFGVESKTLWLPDVFGYSAAMPQILKKSGVDHFVTSKISWNETNQMPMDTFLWQGLDGTEIPTDFITCCNHSYRNNHRTYVGTITPDMVLGTWDAYRQKEYNNETILTFGYGDGGGGPTREMLEVQRRTAYGLPGLPKTRMLFSGDHLKNVWKNMEENAPKLRRMPKWVGELYLELHRGTYTSIAKNKRNNRKSELLLQKAEGLSAIASLYGGNYPAKEIYDAWEVVLLHQFHDIIPGSSIREVYEESDVAYAGVLQTGNEIAQEQLALLAGKIDANDGILVYNPLGFARSGSIVVDGKTVEVGEIPALGWKVIPTPEATCGVTLDGLTAENQYYRLTLDESGRIASLYDKKAEREVFRSGCKGNELQIFEDYPKCYDAWEITNYYKQKMDVLDDIAEITPVFDGSRAGFRIRKTYRQSTICQTMWLYTDNRRIDVENELDWHQRHELLKVSFPVDVHATKATYEIQFGHIERPTTENTTWDAAKFEVCGHKWADISENGYGFSLLNDCKYGFSTEESTLKLTLLKCATYPNEEADQGKHIFTYSLLPHEGDFRQGETIREGYKLNQPLTAVPVAKDSTAVLPAEFGLVSCDKENVIIETVKKAETNDDLIVRLYEAFDRRTKATLTFGFDVKSISLCNLMEEEEQVLEVVNNQVTLPVKNFDILTLRIQRA